MLAAGQLLQVVEVGAEVTGDLFVALVDHGHGHGEGRELDARELVGGGGLAGGDAGDDLAGALHDELAETELVDASLLDLGGETAVVDDVVGIGHDLSSLERVVNGTTFPLAVAFAGCWKG